MPHALLSFSLIVLGTLCPAREPIAAGSDPAMAAIGRPAGGDHQPIGKREVVIVNPTWIDIYDNGVWVGFWYYNANNQWEWHNVAH